MLGVSSPIFRAGLSRVLANQAEIAVVGWYDSEAALLLAASEKGPDVVLVAFDPLRRACELADQLSAPVVALTWSAGDADVLLALRCGVRGLLSASVSPEQLVEALIGASRGMLTYPDGWERGVAERLEWRASRASEVLTPRERETVQMVVDGCTSREMAERMGIATQTAKNHLHHVMSKLGVSTRLQLYAWAREQGFVPGEEPSLVRHI